MDIKNYKNNISRAFTHNTKRGFVDWRDCDSLCIDVTEELERSKEGLCAEGKYAELLDLCIWTYVKWSNTDKDDSNGETQDFCGCVYDIWDKIYQDGEQSISHRKMLDVLIEQLDGRLYDYMEDEVYDFILMHFKSEEELATKREYLLKKMDEIKKKIPERGVLKYTLDVLEQYYARVLADQKKPIQEIRDYLNVRDSYCNKELLAQIETKYGNYDEAIALYKALIDSRPNDYWSESHRKALMEIYRTQGKTDAYNEELYNMMLMHTGEDKYFLEYKALFTEDEWPEKWQEILNKFAGKKLGIINRWLSIENRYDLIMDGAEPDGEFCIDIYGDILFEMYPDRCMKVLANAADRHAKNSRKRSDYRYLAKTLRKIATHDGGKELAAELAAKYRNWYPRRTAMLDELRGF